MEDGPVCDVRDGGRLSIREEQEYHNALKNRERWHNDNFCVIISIIANAIRTAGQKLVARNFDGHL